MIKMNARKGVETLYGATLSCIGIRWTVPYSAGGIRWVVLRLTEHIDNETLAMAANMPTLERRPDEPFTEPPVFTRGRGGKVLITQKFGWNAK